MDSHFVAFSIRSNYLNQDGYDWQNSRDFACQALQAASRHAASGTKTQNKSNLKDAFARSVDKKSYGQKRTRLEAG